MPKAQQRPTAESTVLVVSSKAETLQGMNEYFRQTGIVSASRRAINPLAGLPHPLRALVLFPDDFSAHCALTYLSLVRTRRPDLTIVVVTKDPTEYVAATATDGHPLDAIVLPRPAFGWTILDAIRKTLLAHPGD
jgi:hypothetical protein